MCFDRLGHGHRLPDSIFGTYRLGSLGRAGKRDEMRLVSKGNRLVPFGGRLGSRSPRPPLAQGDIVALLIILLRRVFLFMVGQQHVKDRQAGADQSDTSLGVSVG